jgi:arsenical-resistance protein 2
MLSLKIGNILIIDVRRTDYSGGSIRGSLNIPAQGFWWNRGALYELAYKADIEWMVFTCGSSNGRGPRCAGWFLEHVRNTVGDDKMQVEVLEGGVKGWVKAGEEYTKLMDGYQEAYWKELFEEDEKKKQGKETKGGETANAVGQGDVTK